MSSTERDEDLIVPRKWYDALPRPSWGRFRLVETSHPWFEVYEVVPGTYALYEPGQFQEVISYLAVGEKRAALIDTGYNMGDIKGLVEGLTDLPVTVVNTHTHVDHIGQNNKFEKVAVFDHTFARENAEKGSSVDRSAGALAEGMVWKPFPEGFDPATYHIPPFEVSRWLQDGDEIDLGGRTLEVIHTPGHSPDSVCLLDRGARLLWTGDIFYNAPLYVYGPTTDLDDFIESYRRMVSLFHHYDRLMPGHNETYIDKEILERVLMAAEDVRASRAREYREQERRGITIRRYDYEGFAIIVRAP
jgi:glyoxylase-like metal-dependent hydrolase (beta-lactamase superfamily II)